MSDAKRHNRHSIWKMGIPFLGIFAILATFPQNSLSASLSQKSEDYLESDSDTFAEVITRVGTCDLNNTLVTIALTGEDPLITVCHDEKIDFTLWSKHYIYGARVNSTESGNRPGFKEGGFFPTISADDCYKTATQTETIGLLLNSTSLAQHYIQASRQLFMSRGHLAPNGDPIRAIEKAATFYFINVSPQWQSINGGNWVHLETKLRTIAAAASATLTVWTGSHGIMKLDDANGNPVEIWLGRDSSGALVKKLPANHLTWKVIHDPATRTGVAIIQINNPWLERVTDEDILCDDVCDQLDWVTWNKSDIVKGYTYCCTVQSFREKVDYAPDLGPDVTLMRSL